MSFVGRGISMFLLSDKESKYRHGFLIFRRQNGGIVNVAWSSSERALVHLMVKRIADTFSMINLMEHTNALWFAEEARTSVRRLLILYVRTALCVVDRNFIVTLQVLENDWWIVMENDRWCVSHRMVLVVFGTWVSVVSQTSALVSSAITLKTVQIPLSARTVSVSELQQFFSSNKYSLSGVRTSKVAYFPRLAEFNWIVRSVFSISALALQTEGVLACRPCVDDRTTAFSPSRKSVNTMGAELSRPAVSDITDLKDDAARRRVGSSSALDSRRQPSGAFPMSSSTTSLSSMTQNGQISRNNRSCSANGKSKLLESSLFSSMRRSRNDSKANTPPSSSLGDQTVESLDLPMVEWEGYVTKRGHLVRNWKMRFFTLEGNLVSYYENKVDARNRSHLKGRVNVASVKMDKVAKNGHGFDFSFETIEGKVFYCSVPTHFDQAAWVYFLEAGVDTVSMKQNNKPVYNTYRHGALPDMHTEKGYETYQRMLGGDATVVTELLSYFNKDLVFSSSYPKNTPFSGDYFGREGLLHFFGSFHSNVELVELVVKECELDAGGKSLTVKGTETLKSKHSGTVITQSWTHRVRFGPYGRILRFRVDVDLKSVSGSWKSFGVKNPYSELSDTSIRSNRSLSISMKDFTVYNVIGKGGFGTVVNAVKKSDGQIYALKILEKGKMTKYDVESSFTEMRVAQNIHHPFIAGLRIAFQSRTKLFLGMNYYGGGDLFHHMSKGPSCQIPSDRAHFYTAELVLGIHHLHQHNILYRDIKPENVMIDADGHVALVDFGLAKLHVSEFKGAKTMAGSPQYTAPELLLSRAKRSYGKAADWWSLGILLYEMSVGKSPFYDSNIEKMYHKIQNDPLVFPSKPALADELKLILRGFLQKDPTKRLGTKISDILEHPYFRGIDWDLLLKKQITPPWKPKLTSLLDVEYVDAEFTDLDVNSEVHSPTDKSAVKSKGFLSLVSSRGNREKAAPPVQDPTFKDFTYFCEDPDALVEVTNLVSELRPPPPPPAPAPNEEDSDESDPPVDRDPSIPSECEGTPLSSFVENGQLNPTPVSPSQIHEGLKKLEATMTEQFERVEVTISRGRPPIQKSNGSPHSSGEEQEHDRFHVEKLVISRGPSTLADSRGVSTAYSTQSSQQFYDSSFVNPNAESRDLPGESGYVDHGAMSQNYLATSRDQSTARPTSGGTQPIVEAEF